MKKAMVFVLFFLTICTLSNATQGPTAPVEPKYPNPFFTLRLYGNGEELTPQIWIAEIDLQTYVCALGVTTLNPLITIEPENDITNEDMQKTGLVKEASENAQKKLQRYFHKSHLKEITYYKNKLYRSKDGKTAYVIGLVPIPAFSMEGLPNWLKSADGHEVAIVMVSADQTYYGLGIAKVNPLDKDQVIKAIDRAEKNSAEILAKYLGLKKADGFVIETQTYADEKFNTAWVLGRL